MPNLYAVLYAKAYHDVAKAKQLRSWTYRILEPCPVEVLAGKRSLGKVSRLEDLTKGKVAWFYQEKEGLVYVTIDAAAAAQVIVRF